MFCGHCGKQNPDNAKSCSGCGKQFDKTQFTRENTERIRLSNTQRISKPDLTHKVVPAVPTSPKPKRNLIAIIAGGILLLVLILVIALFHLKSWFGSKDNNGFVKIESSSSEIIQNEENKIMSANDWESYDGNWSAGGYTFSCEFDDGQIECTMRKDDKVWQSKAKIYSGEQSIKVEFDKKEVEFVALNMGKLRIIIDNKQYDAIRTNSLPPEADNSYIDDNNSYMFYSASSGTKTQNNNIIINDKSQMFWPLDKFAISTTDLDRLTKYEIDIIKNEAYARHGYIFVNEQWQEFFDEFDWYEKDSSFTEDRFSKLERQNLDTIILYQREKGWI
ncbi:MAG TPA: YARHG domain-containing protein [Candidatus Butyricicoccus avistercoris]|uniref:YARHG domain-containing protein n=1 Tax=Candidatus Butyricicoccus avistercoris TaxID=2838518 RepID=A0A9D1TI41_9FIRM|nr:YARHG domain-containing protein [Candidatus Butyricicoccus avistercoris]